MAIFLFLFSQQQFQISFLSNIFCIFQVIFFFSRINFLFSAVFPPDVAKKKKNKKIENPHIIKMSQKYKKRERKKGNLSQ